MYDSYRILESYIKLSTLNVMCQILVVLKHKYKIIQVNFNPTLSIRQVGLFNPTPLISYWVYIIFTGCVKN